MFTKKLSMVDMERSLNKTEKERIFASDARGDRKKKYENRKNHERK